MASYGICPLSVVPVRTSASDSSEMASQLLFGELVEMLETKGRQWVKVRCQWDNLVGWVAATQLRAVTPGEFATYNEHFAYNLELMQGIMSNDFFMPITLGAQLPNFDGIRFELEGLPYTFSGQAVFPGDIAPAAEFILKIARRYLHAPFLAGGRSPFGIDDSGLVQMLFKFIGHKLPRSAAQQVFLGDAIDFIEEAQPGDLAFFEDRKGNINHVGLIAPNLQVLHAFGKVRIDTIDHFGIYNQEESRYTHKLRVVKRILPMAQRVASTSEQPAEFVKNQIELF
ncbi:MAG TPA: NlpC/P60 family protein [Saprospiraceae bacterium]|nr:NlpC/P60 family protein [Saprospiraceae bacterium]HMP23368.1 NlpC/P60 family protein [Saprospiraceae bacterium]